ncbi:hypothetical protein SLA2020_375650 [Shorea laevis]
MSCPRRCLRLATCHKISSCLVLIFQPLTPHVDLSSTISSSTLSIKLCLPRFLQFENPETIKTMQMEMLLLFLLLFFSILLSPAAYTLPDHFFINCGSETNASVSGKPSRTFIGDLIYPSSLSFTKQGSNYATNSQTSDVLYQTARIFKQQSSYNFDIDTAGIYLVRLHFFNSTDVSTAVFSVSTDRFSQLKIFTIPRSSTNDSNSPLIDEYFLNIPQGKFSIYFTPQGSSFAFINALEVFLAPENFIPDKAPTPPKNSYSVILSHALQTIYRINVGGEKVTPDDDTLWRTWITDYGFLYNPNTAQSTRTSARPNYQGAFTEFIAPDLVYQTAIRRGTNGNECSNISYIVTWSFTVSKNSRHFVRLHFCDIVGTSLASITFNLYLNSIYPQKIDPYDKVGDLLAPFYLDFVVDSDESGVMNLYIGPSEDSRERCTAFLNGVEIMKIMGESNIVINHDESKKIVFLAVGPAVGGLLVCVLAVGLFIVLKKRKRTSVETSIWSPLSVQGGGSSHSKGIDRSINVSPVPNLNLGLRIPFVEIQFATNNFDKKLLIGKGGFGNVYRGKLKNGLKVAVKRSQPGSGQGLPEFQTEIMILSKIRHRNLVSLIGYCDERFEMILVYEFMENGTLRDHLYVYGANLPCLPWKQRLQICIGAASGLNYLHKGSAGRIIHRDIKSTNILLDENLNAKVADFGLSKSAPMDQASVNTGIKGTFGYLDPEYFQTQKLTEKSDVYSFGVVLLEVLCARPALSRDPQLPREQVNLAEWGLICHRKGLLDTIVDPSIKGQINPNSLRKFAETAEKCLLEDGADRPSIDDVLWDLEYALQLQQTAVYREPHDDSTTEATSGFQIVNVQRLPSHSLQIERDDMPILRDSTTDESFPSASEVFSQLKINRAR